ncbi:MAG: hypothetical protein WBW84_13470 [Acidobacteriaceae bacterium]
MARDLWKGAIRVKLTMCLLIVLGMSPLLAQIAPQSADEKEITALEQQMVQMEIRDHYSQRFIREHVDRKLVMMSPPGFFGFDEFVKPVEKRQWGIPPPTEERLKDLTVTIYGNAAVVHAEVYEKGKDISDPTKTWEEHCLLLHTWVKENGRWRLLSVATRSFLEPIPHTD